MKASRYGIRGPYALNRGPDGFRPIYLCGSSFRFVPKLGPKVRTGITDVKSLRVMGEFDKYNIIKGFLCQVVAFDDTLVFS